jgi:hypothetical protein
MIKNDPDSLEWGLQPWSGTLYKYPCDRFTIWGQTGHPVRFCRYPKLGVFRDHCAISTSAWSNPLPSGYQLIYASAWRPAM